MKDTAWRFTLLGYKAGFAQPYYLFGLLVALLLGLIALVVVARRHRLLEKHLSTRLLPGLTPGTSTWLPVVQTSSYTIALLCFALALAQPQCGEKAEVAKRRGIDVVVALDASKSMYARDVTPSRLDRAKLELTTLLDSLKGDRVGLVVFAGDAFIQCPLTSDYAAAKLFLRAVDPEQMPQGGSNIGAALQLSRQVLENADRGAKDRVVVLLSDGEDLTGDVKDGVNGLKDFGAKVLAVGIGSEEGETIPVLNKAGDVVGYKKDQNGTTVITRLDKAGLTAIAQATSGDFFHQPRGVAMGEVVKVIDTMQKSELESRLTVKYGEMYQPVLLTGLVFLAFGFLLFTSWRRKLPGVSKVGLVLLVAALPARAAGPLEKNHPEVQAGTDAYQAGRFDEALTHYDQALKEKPTDARAHYNRGLALHKLGRHDEASTALQSALSLDREGKLAGDIHYNLGNVAAAKGDKKQALKEYRQALRKNPHDEAARHNMEVLLRDIPPDDSKGEDGGTPDGGGHDGGTPDAGEDAGVPDSGVDAGNPDGGQPDGGEGDGGDPDGGPDGGEADGGDPDGGADGGSQDGGEGDGGSGDGGQGEQQDEQGDGGQGGQDEASDAGSEGEDEPADAGSIGEVGEEEPDAGDLDRQEAEKLLDSLKNSEKNLQLWRFKQKAPKKDPHGKDW